MAATAHSAKALKTLELLGTTPESWKTADIKWVKETRLVPTAVNCPVCEGNKYVSTKPDTYEPVKRPEGMEWFEFLNYYRRDNGLVSVPCQNCRVWRRGGKWRGAGWESTGRVQALKEREVWVGHIQWPQGTLFDSRFREDETDRFCCELCSKTLKGVFSGRVAVVGTDAQGRPHGMWVGEDCARKFLPGVQTWVYPNDDKKLKGEDFVLE